MYCKKLSGFSIHRCGKKIQEKTVSIDSYARMERDTYVDGLTENEILFISSMDRFYHATIGKNGFPAIQHIGGAKGFLKVLDKKRIGFIDFSGNMQCILPFAEQIIQNAE